MVTCMNDPGPIPDPAHPGVLITDPLYNPSYSQFCYEIPFMPGQTQYMDTPVVPTAASRKATTCPIAPTRIALGILRVHGDGVGPWVGVSSSQVASITLPTAALATPRFPPLFDGWWAVPVQTAGVND